MKRIAILVAAAAVIAATVYAFQSPDMRVQLATALDAALRPGKSVLVPEGTPLVLRLEDRLSSEDSHVGDDFKATVTVPVKVDGEEVIPAGAEVYGHVIEAVPGGHISGHGRLGLYFDELKMGSLNVPIDTRGGTYVGGTNAKRSAGWIGGGAVAGGLLGGAAGHSGGSAVTGALLGAAAGTGVSMASRPPDIVLAPGMRLQLRLDHELTVHVQPA